MSEDRVLREIEDGLELCNSSRLSFIEEYLRDYYPQALCLKHPEKVALRSDWYSNSYELIVIAITGCKESPGKQCASKAEQKAAKGIHPVTRFLQPGK